MKRLTHLEEQIMIEVWQLKKCAIKDVVDRLEPTPPYTTVASMFKSLVDKGYLTMQRFGNVKVYQPIINESAYKRHFMSDIVQSYFDNSYKELVSFFAADEKISAKDLEEIIALIEKNKREK